MRNAVRALKALIAVGAALILVAPSAQASVLDQIVVAHRGGAVTRFGEGTMASYKDAVTNGAQILEGDIHWTKDGSDADSVGSIVIIHDSTLDRITNCSGKVSSRLWTSIRDNCYVNVGVKDKAVKHKLIRLKDLVTYATPRGKTLAINLKNSTITNAQAKQLWNTIKSSKVHLHAAYSNRAALNKVKKLDQADSSPTNVKYALSTGGSGGWPSVSRVKSFGIYLYASKEISKVQMQTYKNAGIKVILFTGKTKTDYKEMAALKPYGVVVDDVAKFQAWRDTQV
jgi:glycerophosphoryl diester phosphodiesterase